MVRRIIVVVVAVLTAMTIATAALAVDLDESVCEDDLGGTWSAGSQTCDVSFLFAPVFDLTVPSGVTLNVDELDFTDLQIENFGTINSDLWHNHGLVHNYGTFNVGDLLHDEVVNHCGSSFSVVFDGGFVENLECSVVLEVSADPAGGTEPLDVEWTISLTNDGDESLSGVSIELSDDGGATAFETLGAPPDSGDDGNGALDPTETWVFVEESTESADITLTATSAGTAPSGLSITYPDDEEARADALVTVAAAPTTTTSTTSTTTTTLTSTSTTSSSTSTTVSIQPTTTSSDAAPVSETLPFTGSGETATTLMLASSLVLSGILVLLAGRRKGNDT